MKGAREYYNIIQKAYQYKIGGLKKLNLEHGWNGGDSKAFIYNNFVFVTSSHARGKCLHIFLIDKQYQDDEEIKSNAFEVFGIVGGQPGWTEEYNWLHEPHGKWVLPITRYLGNLQSEADTLDHENMMKRGEQKKEEKRKLQQKIDHFNEMFV
jgi:hypothetical protein